MKNIFVKTLAIVCEKIKWCMLTEFICSIPMFVLYYIGIRQDAPMKEITTFSAASLYFWGVFLEEGNYFILIIGVSILLLKVIAIFLFFKKLRIANWLLLGVYLIDIIMILYLALFGSYSQYMYSYLMIVFVLIFIFAFLLINLRRQSKQSGDGAD